MSLSVANALLSALRGPDPPLKRDNETTDDFQTRTIEWMKAKFVRQDGLLWAILAMHLAQWWGVGGY